MKKLIMVVIALLYSFIGVNMVSAAPDTWTQKADFGGVGRYSAVGFSIGDKGYIGTGGIGTSTAYTAPSKDFWEFDPVADTWTQKADYGGGARWGAVGFSIGNKGYIGTGSNGSSATKDFWEYDPVTNVWTQKADVGGTIRTYAFGVSIGNKGYIGTGMYGGGKKDFWEYDPAINIWTQKNDFVGTARYHAEGFSIGGKGYLAGGLDSTGYKKDFWEYDPDIDTWIQKADIGGTETPAFAFSIGNKGYAGTGGQGSPSKYFFEYDPAADTWTQRTYAGRLPMAQPVGFSIGNKGYLGTGLIYNSSTYKNTYYKDFWEYEPADTTPDPFIFNYETGVDLNTVITSNTITVSGINAAAPISIEGGTYSINGGAYTSADGTVNNGDAVTVQQTSSGDYLTTTVATLTIGGVSDTFSVTTKVESIITLNPVANITTIWPPNLKMVKVTIYANASYNAGGPVTLTAKVSCNELALPGIDWIAPVINQKTGVISLSLRAMRWGIRTDRIYTITITATGTEGNSATKTVTVTVPHDQGNNRGRR